MNSIGFIIRVTGVTLVRSVSFNLLKCVDLVLRKIAVPTVINKAVLTKTSNQLFDARQVLGDMLEKLAMQFEPLRRDSISRNSLNTSTRPIIIFKEVKSPTLRTCNDEDQHDTRTIKPFGNVMPLSAHMVFSSVPMGPLIPQLLGEMAGLLKGQVLEHPVASGPFTLSSHSIHSVKESHLPESAMDFGVDSRSLDFHQSVVDLMRVIHFDRQWDRVTCRARHRKTARQIIDERYFDHSEVQLGAGVEDWGQIPLGASAIGKVLRKELCDDRGLYLWNSSSKT